MYFKNLLNLGRKKAGDDLGAGTNSSGVSPEVGDMAAKKRTVESQNAAQTAEQKGATTKILAVQDGDHSTALVDYAVKMAQKLDCEIIALDVSEEPLEYEGERREREISRFQQRAQRNSETLQLKAEAMGVTCKHIAQVGNQEEIIRALSREDNSIRYVLFKPAQEYVSADRRQARVPVVDLNCSNL